jgi:hypothetical protein
MQDQAQTFSMVRGLSRLRTRLPNLQSNCNSVADFDAASDADAVAGTALMDAGSLPEPCFILSLRMNGSACRGHHDCGRVQLHVVDGPGASHPCAAGVCHMAAATAHEAAATGCTWLRLLHLAAAAAAAATVAGTSVTGCIPTHPPRGGWGGGGSHQRPSTHLRENLPLPLGLPLPRSSWYVARTATVLRLLVAAGHEQHSGGMDVSQRGPACKAGWDFPGSGAKPQLGQLCQHPIKNTMKNITMVPIGVPDCQATTGWTVAAAVVAAVHQLFTNTSC